jgi:membrane protein DedA with SNARE-associated domain
MQMYLINAFIASYGYLTLYLGTVLEGEIVVILGGYFAQEGVLRLPLVILVSFLGCFSSDQLLFFVGSKKGLLLINKYQYLQHKFSKIKGLLGRHEKKVILIFRFVYGFRVITPIALGASGVSHKKFLKYDFLSSAIWASCFSLLGYFVGNLIAPFFRRMEKFELEIILAILTIYLLSRLVNYFFYKISKN